MLVWIPEEDDPELNAAVYRRGSVGDPMRRAVLRGIPFGPGLKGPLPVDTALRKRAVEPPVPQPVVAPGLVGALRAATAVRPAGKPASMVLGHDDWRTVTAADRDRPLPGHARWALSVRPDCPPALRDRFGSHPKLAHRVRRAGVLAGPGVYATAHGPAAHVRKVLSPGPRPSPRACEGAENALRPLVCDHLSDREEAWAVLAQLVDPFHGTAPELIMTAGALA